MSQSFRFAKMKIVEVAHTTEASVIFKVQSGRRFYALKVYHMEDRPEDLESPWHSRWYCESKAYERLKESGACDSGHVFKCFATFSYFDPAVKPEIEARFGRDKHHPCAILLEWVEVKDTMNKDTYNQERWKMGLESFRKINDAYILHRDIYLRNCVVTNETPERVMWIDYDVAKTLDRDNASQRERDRLKTEWRIVVDTAELIEEFAAKGEDLPW